MKVNGVEIVALRHTIGKIQDMQFDVYTQGAQRATFQVTPKQLPGRP